MENNFFNKILSKIKKGGFLEKSQSIIGVDIGSSSIKVVQLKKEKERAMLETYGELSIGPYAKKSVGQVVQISEEMAVAMLKDLFAEAGVNSKEVAFAIPVKSSFITVIKVPMMESKSMDDIIKFEARKYIPVPIGEVEMDWWVIGEDQKKNETEQIGQVAKEKQQMVDVLLVVIYKEIIEKYKNISTKLGLNIKLFEVEIFSGWRSLSFRPTTPVAVIDLGALTTKMSIVEAGVLKSSHTTNRGSQAMTDSVSKSLGISFERAEEMKHQIGLSLEPEHKQLVNVLETSLDFIFSEAKQFIQSYGRKHGNPVGQVVLSGGGALLGGITGVAVKNIGVEVILADPFVKTDYPPFLQNVLKEIGPSFSTSVGLALKGL